MTIRRIDGCSFAGRSRRVRWTGMRCGRESREHRSERDALEAGLSATIAAMQAAGALCLTEAGTLEIGREALRRLEDDPAFVLLQRAVAAVGGRGHGPEGPATIRLLDALRGGPDAARTLAGVRAVPGETITLMREYGRAGIAGAAGDGGKPGLRRSLRGRRRCRALQSGARFVAFGDLGRGNPVEKTLPVLVAGDSLVAIPAQLGAKVAAGTPLLAIQSLVGWSLTRDLPVANGRPGWGACKAAVTTLRRQPVQIAAKRPDLVGKKGVSTYLRANRPRDFGRPFQEDR